MATRSKAPKTDAKIGTSGMPDDEEDNAGESETAEEEGKMAEEDGKTTDDAETVEEIDIVEGDTLDERVEAIVVVEEVSLLTVTEGSVTIMAPRERV